MSSAMKAALQFVSDSEKLMFGVTYGEETFDGRLTAETSWFDSLIEAHCYAYDECYKEKRNVLHINMMNLIDGSIHTIAHGRELYITHLNREHDDEMEKRRWDEPKRNLDGSLVNIFWSRG